jgi:hypothetical protein
LRPETSILLILKTIAGNYLNSSSFITIIDLLFFRLFLESAVVIWNKKEGSLPERSSPP